MNDAVLTELKTHVERAVRPLRVGLSRKRRMREDLLSHLVAVYDEEFAKSGDEQNAVAQARRRFGEPEELTAELRQSVTLQDRLRYWVDRLRLEPGESFLHLVGKHLCVTCIEFGVVSLLMLILLMMGTVQATELGLTLRLIVTVGVVTWLVGSLLVWMSDRLGRALFGNDAERSRPTAIRYCLAALLIFPLATMGIYWGLGVLLPPPTALWICGFASLLGPLMVRLMSRQVADEIRHEEEWICLEIEV